MGKWWDIEWLRINIWFSNFFNIGGRLSVWVGGLVELISLENNFFILYFSVILRGK